MVVDKFLLALLIISCCTLTGFLGFLLGAAAANHQKKKRKL